MGGGRRDGGSTGGPWAYAGARLDDSVGEGRQRGRGLVERGRDGDVTTTRTSATWTDGTARNGAAWMDGAGGDVREPGEDMDVQARGGNPNTFVRGSRQDASWATGCMLQLAGSGFELARKERVRVTRERHLDSAGGPPKCWNARGTECVECHHARSSGTDGAVIEACWGQHGARGDRAWPSEGVPGSWQDGRGHGGGGAHRSCRGGRAPSGRASACCVNVGACVDVCGW